MLIEFITTKLNQPTTDTFASVSIITNRMCEINSPTASKKCAKKKTLFSSLTCALGRGGPSREAVTVTKVLPTTMLRLRVFISDSASSSRTSLRRMINATRPPKCQFYHKIAFVSKMNETNNLSKKKHETPTKMHANRKLLAKKKTNLQDRCTHNSLD